MSIKEKWAYIAGIIDGEGCIGLSPRSKKINRCYVYLRIANTNLEVLKFIKNFTGVGSIQIANSEYKRKGFKKVFYFQAVTRKAVSILQKVFPYLIIKKRQAKIVIDFQKKCVCLGFWNKDARKFRWQKTAYDKIRKLNRKGNHVKR